MRTYRAWKEGRSWVLIRWDHAHRIFPTKHELVDYVRAQERQLTPPVGKSIACIRWECGR